MKQNKKCTFRLNNYEKVFLFIILTGLFASIVSCSPTYKVSCGGSRKMAIYNAGGYR
jgi:hypothetical protein